MFTPEGKPAQFFSQRLSERMIADLNPGSRKTAIFECEFLALFCAMLIWGSSVSSAVVVYTDNNAVRDAMISCHTTNNVAKKILIATLSLESELQLAPWYARVPTDSNMADNPSRLTTSPLLKMGAKQCEVCVEECWGVLVTRAESWGEQQVTQHPSVKVCCEVELHRHPVRSDSLHCSFSFTLVVLYVTAVWPAFARLIR